MLSNGSATTARPRARSRRREFVTTICTEDLGRYAGVGLTLDQVIEQELRKVGVAPDTAVDESDDLVIWEGNKVVALIRIGVDHRPVVTRFDLPAASPAEPGEGKGTDDARHAWGESSPHALALRETRGAVEQFLAMKRRAEEARGRYQEFRRTGAFASPPDADRAQWEQWVNLAREAELAAERHLSRCILALNAKVESLSEIETAGFHRPHCGVILDDRLYLALGVEAGATPVVVELGHLARLDPGRGDAPSGTA
jgi:hypothetical protein